MHGLQGSNFKSGKGRGRVGGTRCMALSRGPYGDRALPTLVSLEQQNIVSFS